LSPFITLAVVTRPISSAPAPTAAVASVFARSTIASVFPRSTIASVFARSTIASVFPRSTIASVFPRSTVIPRATFAAFITRPTVASVFPRSAAAVVHVALGTPTWRLRSKARLLSPVLLGERCTRRWRIRSVAIAAVFRRCHEMTHHSDGCAGDRQVLGQIEAIA
jgi:hypothetical protein